MLYWVTVLKKKWNNFLWLRIKAVLVTQKNFVGKLKKLSSATIDFVYSFCSPKCT